MQNLGLALMNGLAEVRPKLQTQSTSRLGLCFSRSLITNKGLATTCSPFLPGLKTLRSFSRVHHAGSVVHATHLARKNILGRGRPWMERASQDSWCCLTLLVVSIARLEVSLVFAAWALQGLRRLDKLALGGATRQELLKCGQEFFGMALSNYVRR